MILQVARHVDAGEAHGHDGRCRRIVTAHRPGHVPDGAARQAGATQMRKTTLIATVLTGLIVAIAGVVGSAWAPRPAGPARIDAVKTFSQRLDEAQVRAMSTAQWAAVARANSIVVLNSWDFRLVPVLKRANPKVQIWVYKDLSGIRSDDCTTRSGDCGDCGPGVTDSGYLSSGLGYCWVRRNHPGWLLAARGTGHPLRFKGYRQTWETDYGNPAYQRQWIRGVLADVRGHGWDGVEIDNALTRADAYGVAAKYPSDAAVQSATFSALKMIGPALRAAEVPSVFNVGYATLFPQLWQRWLNPVDGLEQEFYLSYSTRPDAVGAEWSTYENEVASCAARHKSCWFHTGEYSAAVTSQTRAYALASYLLATDGRQFLAVGDTASGTLQPHLALGARMSVMYRTGAIWRRYFTGGIAVTNPSATTSVVSLGGTYVGSDGRRVTTLKLGPASGAVLRIDEDPPAVKG
jgi:Hypothetical glycosyl hydrolase family 15